MIGGMSTASADTQKEYDLKQKNTSGFNDISPEFPLLG